MAKEETTKNTGSTGRFFEKSGENKEKAPEKILDAALRVFSRYPYNAATTRMIAKEAGVDHPLIYYYFGSKDKLFEAVTERIYNSFEEIHTSWFEGLDRMRPSAGFSLFLDRLLDFAFENPESFRLITLNMAQIGDLEEMPGHQYIVMRLNRDIQIFQEKFPQIKDRPEVEKFIHCFNNLILSFIGAKSCQAQILNMDVDSPEYRNRIRDSLYILFLPLLEKFFTNP